MATDHEPMRRPGRWLVVAWIGLIVSGASTTGVFRASLPASWIAPLSYRIHLIAGLAIAVLTMAVIARVRPWRAATWICAALAGGVVATGWLSSRSFAPGAGAAHALIAALAAVGVLTALARPRRPERHGKAFTLRPAWIQLTVQLACGCVGVQVAVGALLRHQRIDLPWHLLSGGLAGLALLTPSAAMLQVPDLPANERRAARTAIAAVVVQAALGAAVWLMMLLGSVPVGAWLAATVAHVAGGTLTLMAAVRLALVVAVPSASRRRPMTTGR